jgi:hypothetical protein
MEKSPGWEAKASMFHNDLKQAVAPFRNEILETARIRKIIEAVPAFKGQEQWIYPSDHCTNHTNKGACQCAETDEALFERIKRGLYRIL